MISENRLRASLVFNAVLLAAVLVLVLGRPDSASRTLAKAVVSAPAFNQPESRQYPTTASETDQRRWLIDRLRAMGMPEKVLARIVMVDLDMRWNKQGAELALKSRGDFDTMVGFKLEVAQAKDAEMRAALGDDGFKRWDHENMLREANQGRVVLTDAETDQAYDLWKKLQRLELDLRQARLKGEMDDVDIGDAHEKAFAAYQQQLKALLGDARYAKAQQVDDGTAVASLRQDLTKANPSEAQFQELLKTQQQWNELRTRLDTQYRDDTSAAAYSEQIKVLDEARDLEYKRVLGEKTFDALQKEQDLGYTRMKKYATLWGLDNAKIDYVYGTLKYYQKTVDDYRSGARALEAQGQSVDWNAINRNLQLLAEQTQQSLQTRLGSDAFKNLQQNSVLQFDKPSTPRGDPN